MALGGGGFTVPDKVLPGTYINVISKSSSGISMSERGIVAMSLELDWGVDKSIFAVTNEDFYKNSLKIFGYDYTHDKMKGLRDLFKNAKMLYAYKLNTGAVKAQDSFATAKCGGIRGNKISIIVQKNIDDTSRFDVVTYFDGIIVDSQTVSSALELVDNGYVIFDKNAELTAATLILAGGTNGSATSVGGYVSFFNAIEGYNFNVLCIDTANEDIKNLAVSVTKKMRDSYGVKFQTVISAGYDYDYEGIIGCSNVVNDEIFSSTSIVYWVAGAVASCPVNKSLLNKKYDGEFKISTSNNTISDLNKAISYGNFLLHRVGDDYRVLADINSLTSVSVEKNDDFKNNQTIRVVDQLANDIAALFNSTYLGQVPNNESGRMGLWNDIVSLHKELLKLGAIDDFSPEDITVGKGNDKGSVIVECAVTPVNAMAKLYVTVVVM